MPLLCSILLIPVLAAAAPARDWTKTALTGAEPSDQILRLDIDGDKKPDILERWWNGKRVRWLDENGDMTATDTRGDQVADALQVDYDGNGAYDGPLDQNIKWADNDGDGQADVQAFAINPGPGGGVRGAHWMLFVDVDKDGVHGWLDWTNFDFNCWAYTGRAAWLPDYNGDSVFLKIHAPPHLIEDLSLNWENPFAFYDPDGDGVTEMALRWLAPQVRESTFARLGDVLDDGFVTLDLDDDAAKDNEMDFDITLRGFGGPGIPYRELKHPMPGMKGQPKFDPCFVSNNWRRVDSVSYMPHDKGWQYFFSTPWKSRWLVFDEDDDDHRWERVEMYYPTHTPNGPAGSIDAHSTKRWTRGNSAKEWMAEGEQKPGLGGHPQADSLGDRGEWDADDSGKGRLYVGVFDRKLHLLGAESGAWTVDRQGRYHGGSRIPSATGHAPKVEEVVRYADSDGNGFFDKMDIDYDGDRTVDMAVSLLDYKSAARPNPDVVAAIDTAALGWSGMRDTFLRMANDSWGEAMAVYRAAWRRGLTTPEIDKLANAGSTAQRYDAAHWIKEKVFRILHARLAEKKPASKKEANHLAAVGADLKRLYYLGEFDEYVKKIAEVPGR